MKTIGFVISGKENEKRKALIPPDLKKIRNVGAKSSIANISVAKERIGFEAKYKLEDYIKGEI